MLRFRGWVPEKKSVVPKKAGELIKKSLSIRKWVRAGLEIKS